MATATITPEHTSIGPRVKALREAMGLSLRDLAERTGVSAPMLSPGRARRDEPDAERRRADRHRPRAEPVAAAAPRRGRGRDRRPQARAPQRRLAASTPTRSSRRRCPASAPRSRPHARSPGASTGGPGDPPMHEAGSRETAVVTDGAVTLKIAGQEYRLEDGRLGDLRRRPAASLREPGPARGRALHERRLRRTEKELDECRKTLFDKIWDAHEVAPA